MEGDSILDAAREAWMELILGEHGVEEGLDRPEMVRTLHYLFLTAFMATLSQVSKHRVGASGLYGNVIRSVKEGVELLKGIDLDEEMEFLRQMEKKADNWDKFGGVD